MQQKKNQNFNAVFEIAVQCDLSLPPVLYTTKLFLGLSPFKYTTQAHCQVI